MCFVAFTPFVYMFAYKHVTTLGKSIQKTYKSYKKKCDLNYEPIATLTSRLHALYQQVAIGSGFNILTFKGSVDIEKSLLGLEGREQGRDAKISSSQKGSTIF